MLVIKQAAYDILLAHALSCTEEMACGVLGGKREAGRRVVKKVYPLANASHRRDSFSFDRHEHSRAVSDMPNAGISAMGTWFCHRDSDAVMTAAEIQTAHDRDGSYLVLSLLRPEKPVLRSYRVWGGRADEEELVIEP